MAKLKPSVFLLALALSAVAIPAAKAGYNDDGSYTFYAPPNCTTPAFCTPTPCPTAPAKASSTSSVNPSAPATSTPTPTPEELLSELTAKPTPTPKPTPKRTYGPMERTGDSKGSLIGIPAGLVALGMSSLLFIRRK